MELTVCLLTCDRRQSLCRARLPSHANTQWKPFGSRQIALTLRRPFTRTAPVTWGRFDAPFLLMHAPRCSAVRGGHPVSFWITIIIKEGAELVNTTPLMGGCLEGPGAMPGTKGLHPVASGPSVRSAQHAKIPGLGPGIGARYWLRNACRRLRFSATS